MRFSFLLHLFKKCSIVKPIIIIMPFRLPVCTVTMNCALRFIFIISQTFYVYRKQEFLQHHISAIANSNNKNVGKSGRLRPNKRRIVQENVKFLTKHISATDAAAAAAKPILSIEYIKWLYFPRSRSFLRCNKMPGIKLCVHLH